MPPCSRWCRCIRARGECPVLRLSHWEDSESHAVQISPALARTRRVERTQEARTCLRGEASVQHQSAIVFVPVRQQTLFVLSIGALAFLLSLRLAVRPPGMLPMGLCTRRSGSSGQFSARARERHAGLSFGCTGSRNDGTRTLGWRLDYQQSQYPRKCSHAVVLNARMAWRIVR